MDIIFAKSAAKHSVSQDQVIKIMAGKSGRKIGVSKEMLNKLAWVGSDDFNEIIEIIAIDFITYKFVIHVMPISKRKAGEYEQMEGLW
ncbi:MAG: hypothetical protein ACR2IO_04125 [Candidatus Nanopelagicus sp.]